VAVGIRYFGQGTRPMVRPASTGGVDMSGYVPGYVRPSVTPSTETDFSNEDFPEVDFGDTGLTGVTSTGGSSSAYNTGKLALEQKKFEAEQAAATSAAQRLRAGQEAQAAYIRSQLGAGIPSVISGEIGEQEAAGQSYINTQYQNLLNALNARRTSGENVLTTGYDALRNYLASNVPQAYATAARAVPTTVQSGLEQYLASRGVSGEPSAAEVAAVNAQLAGGATNYNQLLNVLSAQEAAGQQSRLAEEQMARQLGGERIGQIYAGATSGLEQEKLAALNELASRISNARLQAEQQRIAREQALQDALATLLGQGYVAPTSTEGVTEEIVDRRYVASPIEQLAAKLPNIQNQTLANRINQFVAANPTASLEQVAQAFPRLSRGIA
jgi:hypothetical protein